MPSAVVRLPDDTQRLFGGRRPFLRVEVYEQHKIGNMVAECWLDGMVDLGVGMHRAAALYWSPARTGVGAPRTRRGRRITQEPARCTGLKPKVVCGAVVEIFQILGVKLADIERHAEILGFDRHPACPFNPAA